MGGRKKPKYLGGCAVCGAGKGHRHWDITFRGGHRQGYPLEQARGKRVGNITLPMRYPYESAYDFDPRMCNPCYEKLNQGIMPPPAPFTHPRPIAESKKKGRRKRPRRPSNQSLSSSSDSAAADTQGSGSPSVPPPPPTPPSPPQSTPPATPPQVPPSPTSPASIPPETTSPSQSETALETLSDVAEAAEAGDVIPDWTHPVTSPMSFWWWSRHAIIRQPGILDFLHQPIEEKLPAVIKQVQLIVEMDRRSSVALNARDITRVMDSGETNTMEAWAGVLHRSRFQEAVAWTDQEGLFDDHIMRFETSKEGCCVYSNFPQRCERLIPPDGADMKEFDDVITGWVEGVRTYNDVPRAVVGTLGDSPALHLSPEQKAIERLRWQVLVPAAHVGRLIGWSDVAARRNELLDTSAGDVDEWPLHVRKDRALHSGRDAFVFFTEHGSCNGLHKDPVGGFAQLAFGWKVFIWWDAAEYTHLVDRKRPSQGINLRFAANARTLRWTLLAPGDTIFIHLSTLHWCHPQWCCA
jgi:hypothetical protein